MNILIVKLSSLGDVVQTMPVVADMLKVYPEAQIDWVVEEAFAPLVARVQGVRRVIPIALRRWKKTWFSQQTKDERVAFKAAVQSTTYDVVMDGQGLIKSALVARMAKVGTGAGHMPHGLAGSFANKSDACGHEWPVKFLLPNNQPMPKRIHAVARTRLLAAKLLGYESRTDILQAPPYVAFKGLPAQNHAYKRAIMFTHGTTRIDNEWDVKNWQSLGELLVQQGAYRLLLPHSNEHELALCESIKRHLPNEAEILPRMSLPELLDVMSTCTGVIGVDSGLSHMAVALGLPHVQIFSQDRAWRAGPLPASAGGRSDQVAVGGATAPNVDEVWQAWQQVSEAA